MAVTNEPTPPGPEEEFTPSDDLLEWMGRQFSEHGDIFRARAYGTDVYAIRNPEWAHHVLVRNWTNYVKGQFIKRVAILLGSGLMVSEGELWKRQRRMIHPAFHPKSVSTLTQMIGAVNAALRDQWRAAAEREAGINVSRDVSAMALEVVLRSILGDDYEKIGPEFDLLSDESERSLEFAKAFRALGKTILHLTHRRRKEQSSSDDFLNLLIHASDPKTGEPMPDGRIVNETLTLIVAGHETTASTLNWTWFLLSQHPEVERRLAHEAGALEGIPGIEDLPRFPYSRQIIEESMRLYPAGWLLTRKALKDDRLGDYRIPAGSEVYISPYFIQRSKALWDDPERFDPDRFDPVAAKQRPRLQNLPFSAGPRNCIGELFARVEMQIHVLMMAQSMRLRYDQSRPLELDAGVNLRSKFDFVMRPELRFSGAT